MNSFIEEPNYIYDFYLKSNDQKDGILSYNIVSVFIIEYYPWEKLYNL